MPTVRQGVPVIFLDVGTHEGHTLKEVTKDRYDWDEVHGFEPMPDQWAVAEARFPTVSVHPFGLSDRTDFVTMYGANANLEASIYADKVDVDADERSGCYMVRASEFFEGMPSGLVVKLNCEGAEVPILLDLCATGEIHKCHAVMIDFDARRVPSMAGQDVKVLRRLAEVGFDRYQLCEDVMRGGTHQDRIANWLEGVL